MHGITGHRKKTRAKTKPVSKIANYFQICCRWNLLKKKNPAIFITVAKSFPACHLRRVYHIYIKIGL